MADGLPDPADRDETGRGISWKAIRRRARPVLLVALASFRADPLRASLALALRSTAALAGPVFAATVAGLVEAARPGGDGRPAAIAAAVLAIAMGARFVLDELGWKISQVLEERTSLLIDREVIGLVAGLPGIEHLERPEHLDKVERIRTEQWLLSMSVQALLNYAVLLVGLAGSLVLLIRTEPLLAMLPVAAAPSVWAAAKAEKIRRATLDAHSKDYRFRWYLLELGTTAAPAKELRVFGLGPELLRRQHRQTEILARMERDHRLKGAYIYAAARVVFALSYVAGVALVAHRVLLGERPVSGLVLVAVLAPQVLNQMNNLSGSMNWLAWTLTAVRRYVWLLDHAADRKDRHRIGTGLAPPNAIRDSIAVEGLSFRYPGTDREVLRDVDLFLPAGSTVAIVGDNGAGKTTLVKLLCGFYEPDSGRITVDGTDLADIDLELWRARASASFQDHARVELVAREAVGIGDLGQLDDEPAVAGALERAGTDDVLEALPSGLATQLGPQWPGGVDLSGGQWQKLALGRGMLRRDPLLLALDEPTAALDAETEHRLFDRWAEAARTGARRSGTVTVLVSHRFSTVRMADLILVVRDGHVAERGTHEELMRLGGTYAELYGMQAAAYR